jgi:glutathione S-transferase
MSELRIFSYLPNPRVAKATIAARLCGVDVEVRGASSRELQDWLWDFDARPLSEAERAASTDPESIGRTGFKTRLYKTPAFLAAHPFGTVPAAFSPDGTIGIFESNSIMRTVARLGEKRFPLYGNNPYLAARVDSFLDASLIFARDTQFYLLALGNGQLTTEIHERAKAAFATYAAGIDRALAPDRSYLVGEDVTLADICFVAEMTLFCNEKVRGKPLAEKGLVPILHDGIEAEFPHAMAHFARLSRHPAFAPDIEPYLQKIAKHAA